MVRTQLDLDEALHRRLEEIAQRQGRTVGDLVREAVTRFIGAPPRGIDWPLSNDSPAYGEVGKTWATRRSV
jgi:hypothetical protein